jgi:hypothetical protein
MLYASSLHIPKHIEPKHNFRVSLRRFDIISFVVFPFSFHAFFTATVWLAAFAPGWEYSRLQCAFAGGALRFVGGSELPRERAKRNTRGDAFACDCGFGFVGAAFGAGSAASQSFAGAVGKNGNTTFG